MPNDGKDSYREDHAYHLIVNATNKLNKISSDLITIKTEQKGIFLVILPKLHTLATNIGLSGSCGVSAVFQTEDSSI